MKNTLRLYEAKRFENKGLDKTVSFIHDIFFTPFSSAIGTSFVAFYAGTMMLLVAFSTEGTMTYVSDLVG
jgi:hypothetical protein